MVTNGMSKKRPRKLASKSEPGYWRDRIFKNSYTVKGRRFETRGWCVKLQYRGRRKTFSLQAGNRDGAAAEACRIYQALMTQGWAAARTPGRANFQPGPTEEPSRLEADFWAQRLIQREYGSQVTPRGGRELSVRVDHEGASWYFPLGTEVREAAAERALELYRLVVFKGWESAMSEYSREVTVAFHWSNNPLAWTYTTIHSERSALEIPAPSGVAASGRRGRVIIVEADPGVRVALANCIKRMSGFTCLGAWEKAKEALEQAGEQAADLVLIGQNVAEKPGALYLGELRLAVPGVSGLLYSTYEDSEELFRRTPGGAGYYLLRRVGAAEFLEPLLEVFARGEPIPITEAAWNYFKNTLLSSSIGGLRRELTNLTQREQEVLALLSNGHQDKAIADKLGISVYTVHVHVRNIFEKLGVHNRTGAVVKYFQK